MVFIRLSKLLKKLAPEVSLKKLEDSTWAAELDGKPVSMETLALYLKRRSYLQKKLEIHSYSSSIGVAKVPMENLVFSAPEEYEAIFKALLWVHRLEI